MPELIIEGKVINRDTKNPLPFATLKLVADKKTVFATADDTGSFKMNREDASAIPDGTYKLFVAHPDGRQLKKGLEVAIPRTDPLTISLNSSQQFSQRKGIIFGSVLLILLISLCGLYFWLHKKHTVAVDKNLLGYVQLIDKELDEVTPSDTLFNPITLSSLTNADSAFQRISQHLNIDSTEYSILMKSMFHNARLSAEANEVNKLQLIIKQGILPQLKKKPNSYFWEHYPERLGEIFLWALIAILISIIISTGHYIYTNRFIADAMYRQTALIVAIPILAVLLSILLSFIKLNISLGNTSLNLDLTDINISILVAAFIGLAHWNAWNYLNNIAAKFFTGLSQEDSESE